MHTFAAGRDTTWRPLLAAIAAVGVLAAVAQVALHTSRGQRLDSRGMGTVSAGRDSAPTLLSLLGNVSVAALLVVVLLVVLMALARGHVRLGVAAIAVIAGANVTTQVLKHVVLQRSTFDIVAPNSLPSGHTTAVASAVGALLLVAPRVLRPVVVALGSAAVLTTGAATVVAGWHRPADIVAALAVSLAWTAAAAVVVRGRHERAGVLLVEALGGAFVGVVLLAAVGMRPTAGSAGLPDAAAVLAVLVVVTAVTVQLMAWVAPTSIDRPRSTAAGRTRLGFDRKGTSVHP